MFRYLYTHGITIIALFAMCGLGVAHQAAVASTDAATVAERAPSELFDIRLLIDKEDFVSMRDVQARVEFVSFGRVPTPVDITFVVVDELGKRVFTSTTETLVVETELHYPRRFLDAPELSPGNYTLLLETRYKGDTLDTFSRSFTIEGEKIDIGLYVVLGILALGTGAWIAYLIAYIRRRLTRERMIAITTRTATLMMAGVILPTAAQMMTLQTQQEQATQASVMGSLAVDASLAADDFVDYLEGVRRELSEVGVQGAYVATTTETLLEFVRTTQTIEAVHMLDERGKPMESSFRELGFEDDGAPRAVPPVHTGIYRRADGDWRIVETLHRTGGGMFLLESSITNVSHMLAGRVHGNVDVLILAVDGTVIGGTDESLLDTNFFKESSERAAAIASSEYYETPAGTARPFTSRRAYIPVGKGIQWFYIVTRSR